MMFDEPIIESMMDFEDSLAVKVARLKLENKTLQQVKDNSRKMSMKVSIKKQDSKDNEFSALQERKFSVRKPKEPIIILSDVDIKEMKRDSLRVQTLIAPKIDKSLLFVEAHNNTKSCLSIRTHSKRKQAPRSTSSKSIRSNDSKQRLRLK